MAVQWAVALGGAERPGPKRQAIMRERIAGMIAAVGHLHATGSGASAGVQRLPQRLQEVFGPLTRAAHIRRVGQGRH